MNRGCFLCLVNFADSVVGTFLLHPLAVIWWRGTWDLLDFYIYPSDEIVSSRITLIIGAVLAVAGYMIQPYINNLDKCSYHFKFYATLFLYVISIINLCYWRGLWNLIDIYLSPMWKNSTVILILSSLIMCFFKTFRTAVGLPFSVTVDDSRVLECTTAFRIDYNQRPYMYFLDAWFSQYVIISCNVFIWRGFWNIYDAFIYPENILFSNWVSAICGYIGMFLLLLISPILSYFAEMCNKKIILRLIYENLVYFCATGITLLAWRGAWELCKHYILPDLLIGGWLCHLMGTICLASMKVYGTVALNGIEIDCANDPKNVLIFPNSFHEEYCNRKKRQQDLNLLDEYDEEWS